MIVPDFSVERVMAGKLHLVTGMPGTGVRDTLNKLSEYARNQRKANGFECISVETILRELAEPALERLGFPPQGILSVFQLPQEYLRSLWLKALGKAMDRAEVHLAQDTDVILTLHLSYYHHKYRQYIVVANFDALEKAAKQRATNVITFIDDVYDVQLELSRSGEVFRVPRAAEDPYVDGLRVLAWRANEILVSSGLSAALGARHFVFAIKHPLPTLYDLLFSDKKRIYISHPISEIRRLLRDRRRKEALALVKQIQNLVTDLSRVYVVFEPTAIDELRFDSVKKKQTKGKRKGSDVVVPVGNLTERWPFVVDASNIENLAWCAPNAEPAKHNFPTGWAADDRRTVPYTPVIAEFTESVERQISARDHWLVEQSDMVVCFRPIFGGHTSSGVKHELEHVVRLQVLDVRGPRRVVAFVPPEDQAAFPFRELADELLPKFHEDNEIAGEPHRLSELQTFIRRKPNDDLVAKVLSGSATALQQLLRRYTMKVVVKDDGLLDSDERVREEAHAEELAIRIRDLAPYFRAMSLVDVVASEDALRRECALDATGAGDTMEPDGTKTK